MANHNHLLSVTCNNVTMEKQDYYNQFFELEQQKINFKFFELSLPEDDPVYTPIMKYVVLTYANMRRLKKEGLITLEYLYIDGTKIEGNANRYTFVWRGKLNYHLVGLLETIDALYTRYNELLNENEYGHKYDLGNVQIAVRKIFCS